MDSVELIVNNGMFTLISRSNKHVESISFPINGTWISQ